MNSVMIEKKAINYLEESLMETGFLCPHISSDDREPIWDGNIYLYRNKSLKKEAFIGRIPVQVKGKIYKAVPAHVIKYNLEVADLRGFYRDGGVVFFVVAIINEIRKIYYANLLPTTLILLLKKGKQQKTKTITLKEFPLETPEKIKTLMDFYENRKKQQGFNETAMLKIDDVITRGVETVIVESAIKRKNRDFLACSELLLYAKDSNTDRYIPILIDGKSLILKQKHPCEICIKNKIYYKEFERIKRGDKIYLRFGGISFQISSIVSGMFDIIGPFSFKPSRKLDRLIYDLTFVIEAIKNKGFSLNGTEVAFSKSCCVSINVAEMDEQLVFFNQVKYVFKKLNIKKELNVKDLTTTDVRQLNWLIDSFYHNKNIKNIKSNLPSIGFIDIQGIRILCVLIKKSANEYRFYDLFNFNSRELKSDIEKDRFLQELQAIFSIEEYENVYLAADNIDYENITLLFEKLKKNPGSQKLDVVDFANASVLQLLIAYDITKNENQIKAAEKLNEWIIRQNDKTMQTISMLNRLQIIKRYRELTEKEVDWLYDLIEREESGKETKVAAYLLLDNQERAKKHFELMDEMERKEFSSYPIFYFARFEYNTPFMDCQKESNKLVGREL